MLYKKGMMADKVSRNIVSDKRFIEIFREDVQIKSSFIQQFLRSDGLDPRYMEQ